MSIGVLAVQGAVTPHVSKLIQLGVPSREVRVPKDLEGLSGIILPGGESTTMIHVLTLNELWDPLTRFSKERPTWGVCAGTILLSRTVTRPAQKSLGLLDISVDRNAWGRQVNSFIAELEVSPHWKGPSKQEGVFIRAPRIRHLSNDVLPLMSYQGEPVLVESKHLLASTFHPELSSGNAIHTYFVEKCRGRLGG